MEIHPIAHIHCDFPTKFGLPRQSGLVDELEARVVFEPEYCVNSAFRGLAAYSHIWLIWGFSKAVREKWSPTVRPPRLGGNTRMGVFATRSPYRPNGIGLSSVRLVCVEEGADGICLRVRGSDLMDGTPIYDVKPYLAFTDSHPDAQGGFADAHVQDEVAVQFPETLLAMIPADKRAALLGVLRQNPRPAYQDDPARIYGFEFSGFDVKFQMQNDVLTVCRIDPLPKHKGE